MGRSAWSTRRLLDLQQKRVPSDLHGVMLAMIAFCSAEAKLHASRQHLGDRPQRSTHLTPEAIGLRNVGGLETRG